MLKELKEVINMKIGLKVLCIIVECIIVPIIFVVAILEIPFSFIYEVLFGFLKKLISIIKER